MVGADGWRRRLAGTSQSGPDPWRGNTWTRHLDQEHLVVVRQETPVSTSTCAWTGAIWELVNFAAAGILEEAWSWVQVKSVKLGWQAFWKVCLEQQLPGNNCKNSQTVHKKLWTIVTTFVTREERSETLLSEKRSSTPKKCFSHCPFENVSGKRVSERNRGIWDENPWTGEDCERSLGISFESELPTPPAPQSCSVLGNLRRHCWWWWWWSLVEVVEVRMACRRGTLLASPSTGTFGATSSITKVRDVNLNGKRCYYSNFSTNWSDMPFQDSCISYHNRHHSPSSHFPCYLFLPTWPSLSFSSPLVATQKRVRGLSNLPPASVTCVVWVLVCLPPVPHVHCTACWTLVLFPWGPIRIFTITPFLAYFYFLHFLYLPVCSSAKTLSHIHTNMMMTMMVMVMVMVMVVMIMMVMLVVMVMIMVIVSLSLAHAFRNQLPSFLLPSGSFS